jgi:glycosyltransferase involved in cell wall biosynthesis
MKLVFLSSSTGWGGLEQNLLRYAQWMQESENTVTLLVVEDSPLHQKASTLGVPLQFIRRQQRHFPWRSAYRLNKRLKSLSAEVLWIRDPRDLPLAALAINMIPCQLIFQQGMQILHPKKSLWHRWRFSKVDHWVTPLQTLETEALRNTTLKPRQMKQIPLALGPEWFGRSIPKNEARQTFKISNDSLLVGLFGRLDPLKGQDILLQALASAQDWEALIVGSNTANKDDDWAQRLRLQAIQLGVNDRIHWQEEMDSLALAYAACDVYAMCSMSETFGMVTLEALASGIPVIGTNSGGTPELLAHGKHGKLIPPSDANALAEALRNHTEIPTPSLQDLKPFHKSSAVESWLQLLDEGPRGTS